MKWEDKRIYVVSGQLNEGVIKLSIIDASHFSKKVYTPFISICNLPFRLSAKTECSKRTNNQKYFSLYVDCYPDSESCLWSCLAEVEIRIKASNLNDNDIVKCFQHDYTYKTNNMGYPSFVEWEKLIDETNSFLHEGTLTIEATIKIINIFGIREKITYDFTQSESLTSDVKLNIDGINIYVNKDYLSLLSPVFKTMFYSSFVESNMKEVCLQQINIDDFIELLEVIYPSHKEINDKNVGVLLELGDRFEISYVMEKCEKFLMDNDKISFASKLVWSDTYRLPKLQDACLSTFKSASDLKTFRYSDEYRNISDATKVALYEKFFKLF
uniref:BTB domain-containing protein n=1 Tax=Parastrongyloides trichosuri TaxID=131310 RepID=A0A0N4ZU73_PARTI